MVLLSDCLCFGQDMSGIIGDLDAGGSSGLLRHCPGQIFGRKFCLPEGLLVYVPESCLIECCRHHPPKVVPDQLLGKEV